RLRSEIGRLPFRRTRDSKDALEKPAVSGHFRRVSTCRHLPCQGSALPLSYAPDLVEISLRVSCSARLRGTGCDGGLLGRDDACCPRHQYPELRECDRNYQSDRCVDLGCQRDGWCSSAMSQQAGNELSVYQRVARAAKGDQRKGACYDRPYPQQATLQSQFFDFLACRRGNARLHGCRATTSDLTRCDAARRDQARAPWRATARYQLDRSDLSASNRFPTASSRQWRHGLRRFRYHRLEGR